MYAFMISIHVRPAEAIEGPPLHIDGQSFATLELPQLLLSEPFELSFEDAVERIAHWPRMLVEPDGSFVWVSSSGDEMPWQVDGNLYDRDERLLVVDLKGECPRAPFDQLLTALGWPQTPLLFQLTREAVFLGEEDFRRWAELRHQLFSGGDAK